MTELHAPYTFRNGVAMPNRLALAPMTNGQSEPNGDLGEDELTWLARRVDGGFGMITTCAAHVAQDGKAWAGELGIDDDARLPGLTRLAERLHTRGGLGVVQLFHGGLRASRKHSGAQPWSASAHEESGANYETPRPATEEDLARVIEQFAAAAARAERAGFQGVEVHGAHGYLPSQFLSTLMNQRGDRWGGSLENRARLVREITRAIRARVSAKFVVGVRLSLEDYAFAKGLDLDESLEVARQLADDGADFLHASLWDVEPNTKKRPEAHPLELLRAALPAEVAIMVAGSIWTVEQAQRAMERGADLISLGRAAVLNPDWPDEAKAGTSYEPRRPPMAADELVARAVSPKFVEYLRRWPGFVA
jgi:2,4-dienoyl-CoA reductase-like NADH-dependent reductase (Old Yellow Enzyme family)